MRLSTRGQYGLRAMYEFALEYEKNAPVALGVVADRAHIPGNYLEQLARKLREEGLLRSHRGPKGGYILTRDPDKITIGEILRAVEEISRRPSVRWTNRSVRVRVPVRRTMCGFRFTAPLLRWWII